MRKSEEERCNNVRTALINSIVICLAAVIISSLAISGLSAQETGETVEVRVTPESEYVEEGATFSVTLDVDDVTDLETGQFDLSFDSDVLELKDVEEGSLGGETLPIVIENLVDAGTVRVVCVVSEETASGSGHLAKVTFNAIGAEGKTSRLDISDGELSDTGTIWFYIDEKFRDVFNGGEIPDEVEEKLKSRERTLEDPTVEVIEKDKKWKITDKRVYMVIAKDNKLKIQDTGEIFTNWVNAEITVGGVDDEEEEGEEVSEEVITPGSPKITVSKPAEAVVGNVVRELRAFNICVNQIADISWQINGSVVQTNESVTEASFTKSAVIGSWNVSTIATNTTTGLSDTHTWIWHVTLTATPSPTLAPRVTPAPTRAPGVTPTPKPTAITRPTTKLKSTPTPTPTTKPAGFEVIFAIAMLAIAFLWVRKR
uniref:Cohesin domain-containing protein n=1 Tax=Candidatus Methanophaga sp. ANME-1 ERB7 TaxID=2759913 RepID=A0A7G9ZAS3_9EURY|nr:hypothetical protein DPOOOCMC_00015 [Methanosarcinales archaeon ANME-1 ERB7]